jgi:hypothetical protein
MARKFLTPIDLNKNELQNAAIQNLASDPSTPATGQIYFNTGGSLKVYNGTSWQVITTGTIAALTFKSDGTGAAADSTFDGSSAKNISYNSIGAAPTASPTFTGTITTPLTTAGIVLTSGSGVLSSTATIADSYLATISTAGKVLNSATTAATANGASTIVSRDASGNFAANTITANLTGTAANATVLQTPRAINGTNFDGSAAITVTANAGTLTHTTLASGVTASSLTSVGTLNGLTIAATQTVSMGGNKITNVGTPTSDTDAATKAYVDSAAQGIDWKASVHAATTANGTLATAYANGSVIDGVTLVTGDRILIKDQTTGTENGIYTVNASGAPTRATDADVNAEVTANFAVFVEEGTANADSGWVLTTNAPITVGTTALVFTQFTGLGQVTAGNGLTKTGNTLNAVGTADRITANTDSIDIASTYAGQSTIVTLGNVTTGTWSANVIAGQYGGTGVNNSGKTITLGGNLTTSGAHATTLTTTGTTTVTLPTSGTLLTTTGSGSSLTFGTGTLSLAGNVTHAGSFTQSFTATGNTSLTLPTSGTLATLAGSEALTNKTINGLTVTSSTGTLTVANSKTATINNTLTLAGTDSTTMTFPSTSSTVMTLAQPGTLTGSLTLRAGTASVGTAPLYLTSGTNLTSAAAGAVEFDGTNLFFTPSSTRKTIAFTDSTMSGNTTGSAATLTTSRALWGQNFNGSAAVTGALTGATSITGTSGTNFIAQAADYASTSGQGPHAYLKGGYATAVSGTAQGGNVYVWAGGTDSGSGTAGSVNIGAGEVINLTGTVKLVSLGTSGFVKLSTGGTLVQDTNTYLTSASASSAGFTKKYAENNGALTAVSNVITWTVTHNLNTSNVVVDVYQNSSNASVEVDVVTTSANVVTLTLNSATLAGSEYRAVVIG